MNNPPSGTVTFLFTDIEGSTKLAQQYPEQWETLRERHHAILREAIESCEGTIFQDVGDALCAAFHTAPEALKAALNAQRGLYLEAWDPAPVRVRMGLHTGAAQISNDSLRFGYTGYTTLALTARIMSAGHGGQILLSGAMRELVRGSLPENTELIDLGEKRLKDLLSPERISQLNSSDLPNSFPPLKTLDSYPNNLPMQLTTFVGREREAAEVKAELEARRLVTLTGSGGTGKTRLSLQVAADVLEAFGDGVWFVELAPLTDPALIPLTILSVIGINGRAGKLAQDILKEYLVDKQILIVLDNCEHLIEASSKLANVLLNTAPGLKILASSREALGVQGELSYRVPSLSLPDPSHLPAIESLSQFEAVRLFIDRALLVSAHFAVDNDNAAFVAQICYRLDGIPLAIELAAARIKMMSVEQISARLHDRFRLLTGGARTALPRQQTLRALIDWSYDLLNQSERLLLRRLSVFAGGWTLEAAEAVCSGEGLEPYEVLDPLSQLVNKSLVSMFECTSCREMRYRMLETIRQYAREKLFEDNGSKSTRQRHLVYYAKLAEQAGPELTRSQQAEWLDRLEDELDNLRTAVEWALANDIPSGLRLLVDSQPFWEARGNRGVLSGWLRDLLEHFPEENALRARAQAIFAWRIGVEGDLARAGVIAKQSLEISRRISDQQAEANSLLVLGASTWFTGDSEGGNRLLEQSLVLYRALGDKVGQASALNLLSQDHGDLELSKSQVSESLRLCREAGHLSGIAKGLNELALRSIWVRNFSASKACLEEAQQLYIELDDRFGKSDVLTVSGLLAYWMGDYAQACQYFAESIEMGLKSGNDIWVIWSKTGMGYAFLREGNLPEAREMFAVSIQMSVKADFKTGVVYAIEGAASLAANHKQAADAVSLFAWADAMRSKLRDPRPPIEQFSVERDLAKLHSELDGPAFAALSVAGSELTMEQAIAAALEI